MKYPEQKLAKMIGLNGCYFTCLLYLAELITHNNYDIVEEFAYCYEQVATDKYRWVTDECFVYHPELILGHYINKNVTIEKTKDAVYTPNSEYDEYIIGCYVWGEKSHFVVLDKNLKLVFDPLGESNTVKNGSLKTLRILRVKK